MPKVNLNRRFIAIESHDPKTFNAVTVKNLATGRKSYTPTINRQPLNVNWTTKSSAIEYAKRVFNRYRRLLRYSEENCNEKTD